MEIVLVRHGQSVGNRDSRMQGHHDLPLTDLGREQAGVLGDWLKQQRVTWSRLYVSPLSRARQTAEIIVDCAGGPAPVLEPSLIELSAGVLEGLLWEDIAARFPHFSERHVTEVGDFSEFGGESYDAVQARARALRQRLENEHRERQETVLLVGHGGFNFQLLKSIICEPVPRACIVRMPNCAATKVRLRTRYGVYMGELAWHVTQELMGGADKP